MLYSAFTIMESTMGNDIESTRPNTGFSFIKVSFIVVSSLKYGSEKRHKKIAIQLLRKTTVWRKSDLSGKIHTLIGFRNFILTLVFRGCQGYFILQ